MKKKLLSGLFWVLLLNLLIKPFWILGIECGVQNAVAAEEYGLYTIIASLAYIFNILLDLGVTNFNTRNIAQHPQLITKHLSEILSIKLMLFGLYVLVTFSVGLLFGYGSRQFCLLAWITFNQFLNSLIIYLRSNFEGLLMFKLDSVLSIMDRLLMIVICGCLLWGNRLGTFRIEWFVYSQTAAYILTALLALVALIRKTGFKKLHFRWPFTLAILKQSAPFALLVLLMASYNRIDPVLLGRLLPQGAGTYQAGIYASAFRLLDALTMIAYLVSVPLLPVYSKLTKERDNAANRTQINDITLMVFSIRAMFSVTLAVTCSFLDTEIMDLMYTQHVDESARVFRILIFGIVPISMTYIFGTLLTANGNLLQLNILAASTLILNILINILLIPRIAAVGSAWASLAAQSFMALTQMLIAMRIFSMRPTLGYICRIVLFVVAIIAANLLCSRCRLPWGWQIASVLSLALALAFALKLVNIKEMVTTVLNDE